MGSRESPLSVSLFIYFLGSPLSMREEPLRAPLLLFRSELSSAPSDAVVGEETSRKDRCPVFTLTLWTWFKVRGSCLSSQFCPRLAKGGRTQAVSLPRGSCFLAPPEGELEAREMAAHASRRVLLLCALSAVTWRPFPSALLHLSRY